MHYSLSAGRDVVMLLMVGGGTNYCMFREISGIFIGKSGGETCGVFLKQSQINPMGTLWMKTTPLSNHASLGLHRNVASGEQPVSFRFYANSVEWPLALPGARSRQAQCIIASSKGDSYIFLDEGDGTAVHGTDLVSERAGAGAPTRTARACSLKIAWVLYSYHC
jgi:hypothetical protein